MPKILLDPGFAIINQLFVYGFGVCSPDFGLSVRLAGALSENALFNFFRVRSPLFLSAMPFLGWWGNLLI